MNVKKLLSGIEVHEIVNKIDKFRSIDLRNLSDWDLFNAIGEVISVNVGDSKKATLFMNGYTYKRKTRFYRIRKFNSKDPRIVFKKMSSEQDAWNPPSEMIKKRNRLNKIGESLLYLSTQPETAMEELKVKHDDLTALIIYEAKQNIKTTNIGLWMEKPFLSDEENLKVRLICNFLREEFTRDVGKGTEYLYRVSERIAKDFFDLPEEASYAWRYPSIASKPSVNICFRPHPARKYLKLIGFHICNIEAINNKGKQGKNYELKIYGTASGMNSDGSFLYHPINSKVVKERFPSLRI